MSRRTVATAVALGAAILGATQPADVRAQPIAPVQQLQGSFQMTGTVTAAVNILGEHVGDAVQRTWTFTPLCSVGNCATVQLVRQRATRTDVVILHASGPSTYTGSGRFYAPLRCTGRIYRPGQAVPFTITVRVTATQPSGTATVATGLTARYVNSARLNLTPCIGILGHDAARYTGQLATG